MSREKAKDKLFQVMDSNYQTEADAMVHGRITFLLLVGMERWRERAKGRWSDSIFIYFEDLRLLCFRRCLESGPFSSLLLMFSLQLHKVQDNPSVISFSKACLPVGHVILIWSENHHR